MSSSSTPNESKQQPPQLISSFGKRPRPESLTVELNQWLAPNPTLNNSHPPLNNATIDKEEEDDGDEDEDEDALFSSSSDSEPEESEKGDAEVASVSKVIAIKEEDDDRDRQLIQVEQELGLKETMLESLHLKLAQLHQELTMER